MTPIQALARVPSAAIEARRLRSLRLTIKANAPVDSGKLKRSWDDPRTVQRLPSGVVQIDNKLPYARIQDQGGTIPPYDIIAAKGPGHVMRAVIAGQVRFFTRRGKIEIAPQNYVSRAVSQWQSTPLGAGQTASWGPKGGGTISTPLISAAAVLRLRQATEAQRLNAEAARES